MTDAPVPSSDILAALRSAGFAPIHRGVLRLTGGDRVRFLQGLVTNDVATLTPGQGARAVVLNVKGRVVADVLVLVEADALLLALPPEITQKVETLLGRYAIADDVELTDLTPLTAVTVLVGASAPEIARGLVAAEAPRIAGHHVSAAGIRAIASTLHGASTIELWSSPDERPALIEKIAAAGALPLDAHALEVLRVEAGEPRYGVDVSEDHFPLEARLDSAISFTKGCYLGQEVIARATARGHINRQLVGLRAEGDVLPPVGARLSGPGRDDAGEITSVVRSPSVGAVIALGYVHRSLFTEGTQLLAHLPDGGTIPVAVHALPFVPAV